MFIIHVVGCISVQHFVMRRYHMFSIIVCRSSVFANFYILHLLNAAVYLAVISCSSEVNYLDKASSPVSLDTLRVGILIQRVNRFVEIQSRPIFESLFLQDTQCSFRRQLVGRILIVFEFSPLIQLGTGPLGVVNSTHRRKTHTHSIIKST